MTLSLYVDKDYAGEVATTSGWGDVRAWAEGLDEESYPQIHHLTLYGWSQHLSTLSDQFGKALKAEPPDETVVATVEGLISSLADYVDDSEAVCVVTDGVG